MSQMEEGSSLNIPFAHMFAHDLPILSIPC